MKIGQKGLALIKEFESFRAKPYLCSAGKATIGYGNTFYPDKTLVTLTDTPISEEKASEYLQIVVDGFVDEVMKMVKVALTQNELDAIACFTYNVGVGAFSGSTMLKKLNKGDKTGAAAEFLRWDKANGKSLKGLTRRREAEKALFLTPDEPANTQVDPLLASTKNNFEPIV